MDNLMSKGNQHVSMSLNLKLHPNVVVEVSLTIPQMVKRGMVYDHTTLGLSILKSE